ncbi:MAG TPA: peptidoglycan-binding protein [Galbitalea sp.]|nr:peptidoglycan-binding protein [Galbitalea sp.]
MTKTSSPVIGAVRPTRHRIVGWTVILVILVATSFVIARSMVAPTGPAQTVGRGSTTLSTVTVTRRDLSAQTSVSATLGYAGAIAVVNWEAGTLTAIPAAGATVGRGQVLYRVDNNPVVIFLGTTPVYRTLEDGDTGPDVSELNNNLVVLGYATQAQLPPGSDRYSGWTVEAVLKFQKAFDLTQTGSLALGSAIFEPEALRITAATTAVGSPVGPGQVVVNGSSSIRQVQVDLDTGEEFDVAVGESVTITLPNDRTTPGTITSVGTVATIPQNGGDPTVSVLVTPSDPAATGSWDQAPVTVAITTAAVKDALVVPVDSLLSVAGGRYAVEVIASTGAHRIVDVSPTLFDDADGLVAVTGSHLSPGQKIVVPSP